MPATARKRTPIARLRNKAPAPLTSNALTRFLLSSESAAYRSRLVSQSPALSPGDGGSVSAAVHAPAVVTPQGLPSSLLITPVVSETCGDQPFHPLPAVGNVPRSVPRPPSDGHVVGAAILQVGELRPLPSLRPPYLGDCSPQYPDKTPGSIPSFSPRASTLISASEPPCDFHTKAFCTPTAVSAILAPSSPLGSTAMPPKTQKPSASQKKHPATPLPKQLPWSDPPGDDGASTPPLTQRPPQEDRWGPSSDSQSEGSDQGARCPKADRRWAHLLRQLPTKEDFRALVAEVKEACKIEIAAVRQDLRQVSDRVESLESEHDLTRRHISQLQAHVSSQEALLQDTRLHLEDLDNRGRRNNIRIRGLPEVEGVEDLQTTLESIFNRLLDAPTANKILMDRAHRALRPKKPNGPPREVICRIQDYTLKEKIMFAARNQQEIKHEGSVIQLYPDLAWATLHRRRQLQPLLALLRTRAISYRWGFPFSLTAFLNGKSVMLRSPTDLSTFCTFLNIEQPSLPDWDQCALPQAPLPVWRQAQQKRRRLPSRGSSHSTSGHRSPPTT